MALEFRGCLVGSTVSEITGTPMCCTESCIIVQAAESSELDIIGELPFDITMDKRNSDLHQLLNNILEMQNIACVCIGIGTNCMIAVIQEPQNGYSIVLLGNNQKGNLGLSSSHMQYIETPIVIPMAKFLRNSRKINKIICTESYSLLLDDIGCIYECRNHHQTTNTDHKMDENDEDIDIKSDDNFVVSRINPIYFNNENIIKIECGLIHNIALSEKHNVYCWGSNLYHCCGETHGNKSSHIEFPNIISHFVSPLINVTMIDCGLWHCCVMTQIGDVYTWGLNKNGQLGIGQNITHSTTPQLVVFDDDGDIECIAMSSGARHIAVIDSKLCLWGWGYNKFGQIISSNSEDIWKPLKMKSNGDVKFVKCGHWYTIFG